MVIQDIVVEVKFSITGMKKLSTPRTETFTHRDGKTFQPKDRKLSNPGQKTFHPMDGKLRIL